MFSWRSEDRINSLEEQWIANHFSGPLNGGGIPIGPIEDDRRSLQDSESQRQRQLHQLPQRGGAAATRSGQSTDDSTSNTPRSSNNYNRSKVTSSSDDYVQQPMTGVGGYDRAGTLPRSFRASIGRNLQQDRRREDSEERESVRSSRRARSNSVKSGRLSSYEESDGIEHSGGGDGRNNNTQR